MTPFRGYAPKIVFFVEKDSNFFFSATAAQVHIKFGLVVVSGIFNRTDVEIFYSMKNMAAMAKNRTWGPTLVFGLYFKN